MPLLILGNERFILPQGETPIGGTGAGSVSFAELAAHPVLATISVMPDGRARLLPGSEGAVYVNGTFVTAEGRTLVHGARIDVAGVCILFGDAEAGRSTVHAAVASPAGQAAMLAGLSIPEGTASTGGRLTARVGNGVYPIPEGGLDIGRDPACGVVLLAGDVSRRHARIAPGVLGYVLTDLSANGVLVNGARVDGSRVLGQGDVIRIGVEEWVFAADEAPVEAAPARPAAIAPAPAAAAVRSTPTPALALLATLEIMNAGVLKGTRFRIERPVVHIGRGAHNDIGLADDSVSSSHATLSRRGSHWVVADLNSTNGTYIDGDRLTGERVLRGAAELRFGGIKAVFRPLAGSGQAMGTQVLGQIKKA